MALCMIGGVAGGASRRLRSSFFSFPSPRLINLPSFRGCGFGGGETQNSRLTPQPQRQTLGGLPSYLTLTAQPITDGPLRARGEFVAGLIQGGLGLREVGVNLSLLTRRGGQVCLRLLESALEGDQVDLGLIDVRLSSLMTSLDRREFRLSLLQVGLWTLTTCCWSLANSPRTWAP